MMQTDILIVEDELLIAHDLSRRLKKLGYKTIDIVSSGEAALRVVAEKKPSLILMDIVIKGELDGIDTAFEIYKQYHIPIVYLTAYGDNETIRRAEKTGSYGYIIKPFNERQLHATIQIALHKHKSQKSSSSEEIDTSLRDEQAYLAQLAKEFIQINLTKSISIEEIASSINISQRHLERLFTKYWGCSPKKFITRLRLDAIHEELKRGENLGDLSELMLKYQFNNPGRCSQIYKETFGELPSETAKRYN